MLMVIHTDRKEFMMAIEKIQLVPDEELQKQTIRYQIQNNLLTHEDYLLKSAEEQAIISQILFEEYANKIEFHISLAALEYMVFALAKIFIKKDSGQGLTATEQEFYDGFKNIVNSHEVSIDSADNYYLNYIQNQLGVVLLNRQEYKSKKNNIMGDG